MDVKKYSEKVVTTSKKNPVLTIIFLILLIIVVYGFVRLYIENTKLIEKNKQLDEAVKNLNDNIAQAQKEKSDLMTALQNAADKNQLFAYQLDRVTKKYNDLEWLNSVDPQLLQKYSKVYFLNENYTPKVLSPVDSKYLYDKGRSLKVQVEDRVLPFMQSMIQAAASDGVTLDVASAYRSFGEQSSLKSSYRVIYGSGANAFSADQGYSEHQLGTAIDFTTPSISGGLTGFQKTDAYTWLQNNAYKFGFILSYPQNNAYYVFEPWHWRFVGLALALKLHDENKNFYDLDQREINTYLGSMFSATISTSTAQ